MAKHSKWWYLLPIFVPLIGGVIGYFIHAKNDKKFAMRMLWTGLIVAVALFAFQIVMGYFAIQYLQLLAAGVI